MLRIGDILSGLLQWAPASLAWDRDNIGLLLGSAEAEVRRVLVCLDVTPDVAKEAAERDVQCIVAHHPIIFHPLKSIRTDSTSGALIADLLRDEISVIAMHTNADATHGGLNSALGAALLLENMRALDPARGQRRQVLFRVSEGEDPTESCTHVLKADENRTCALRRLEDGQWEIDVETTVWDASGLKSTMQHALGSRLVAMHTIALEDKLQNHGIGAVGRLAEAMTAEDFTAFVKKQLDCPIIRTTPFLSEARISTVAVSSGAGSSYVEAAVRAGADALVTGDLTHHTFLDYQHDILLVDAGHYGTEKLFIRLCSEVLSTMPFQDTQKIDILTARTDTNPIRFV
ncbi:MAG: Nif3-like dinuclear metal center hexameric protein [Ignavibacteria bacterium]|nr:MAG: Nif3-like dinuclear metal center hexameric protein [Ignavibacteria bacterium]